MNDPNQTTAEIVRQARELMQSGSIDEARELLLRYGYVEASNPKIQDVYAEFVRPSAALSAWLKESAAGLRSSDPIVRRRTAQKISRAACKSWHKDIAVWARDPRAIDLLLEAARDADEEVVKWTAVAIGAVVTRYLADRRATPTMRELLHHRTSHARFWAAQALGSIGTPEDADRLVSLLRDREAGVRLIAMSSLSQHLQGVSEPKRAEFTGAIALLLKDKDPDIRNRSARILGALRAREHAAAIRAARKLESNEIAREGMSTALSELQ